MAKRVVPDSIPGLLEFSGVNIYGRTCWRGRLAGGLGISRSTLRLWLNGDYKSDRDIDSEILALIDRERDSHLSRGVELTALRNELIAAAKRRFADVAA